MAGPIVDLVLLRGLFTDTTLRPGIVLAAKVLEREGARGTLLLNGVRVPAQLPPELAAGDALRLRVTEATAERIALQVVAPDTPPDPSPATVGLPLPGGARFRVEEHDAGGAAEPGGERRAIALRFDSPALGRLDVLLDLDPGAASATVHVAAGAAELARSAANELRDGLADATGRRATVRVEPRPETLDVHA
ncbi:MAG TPA: flagellar hook-length control protein FliK [Solirubrobacteraceae bacterium]|nr:flagellar hook-length control protein FliK [Solirubrobacteraceae bacterium]